MEEQPAYIILFDGVCNLCDSVVQFVIKRDKKQLFHFAALQSEAGNVLLKQYNLPLENFNTFILIEKGKVYNKSAAALKIVRHLDGAVKLLYGFIVIPKVFIDAVYSLVAKNRYRIFGRRKECMLPTPALKQRFL